MTVTSALKSLPATVDAILNAIIFDNTWGEHVGKIESLGLVSGDDMSINYVGLPLDSTQWNDDFTVDDYKALVKRIFDGDLKISDSLDAFPETDIKVHVREGTIR